MNPIRTIVVDDHVILRDGIASLLEAEPDFKVVGGVGTVAGALALVRQLTPDLVLMDYRLPDGTGLEATREIKAAFPETLVVVLTMHEEDDLLFSAVRSGASGYLLKNISSSDMLKNLRALFQGENAYSSGQSNRILAEFARTSGPGPAAQEEPISLTPREMEVLRFLVLEATNQEIAAELHISLHTVKNHVHHILEKLGVDNRRQAAEVAVNKRLFSTGNQ